MSGPWESETSSSSCGMGRCPMPDDTIARAMSHIDSTADERDELRHALDVMTDERDAALLEVARLTAQLADADRRTAEAVEMGVRHGYALGSGRNIEPYHYPIERRRRLADELEWFADQQHDWLRFSSRDVAEIVRDIRAAADYLEANLEANP